MPHFPQTKRLDPTVPNVPEEEGNTNSSSSSKICNPAKKWVFTLNNWIAEDVVFLKTTGCAKVPKMMFQSEVGEQGTPHLQGWIEFEKKRRPFEVFQKDVYERATHLQWATMKGTIASNVDYCGKVAENGYTGEVRYNRGVDFPYTGPIITLRPWQTPLVEMLKGPPSDRHVYWIWSEIGKMGKSTFAKWLFHNLDDVIVTGGKANDMKNGVQTYIKVNSAFPKVVIIDIPRVNRNHFSVAGIEEIKNMFFFSGKYEGGMVSGPIPHVICFSNCLPAFAEMSEDRWQIMDLETEEPEFVPYCIV